MPATVNAPTASGSPIEIDLIVRDDEGVDASSITFSTVSIRKRDTTALIPTSIKAGTLNTTNPKAVIYTALLSLDNITEADNGVYDVLGTGVKDTASSPNTMTETVLDQITIAIGGAAPTTGAGSSAATTSPGRNINLAGLTTYPDPAAEWFAYTDAAIAWNADGMNITHAQGTPGFIGAIVLGPAVTPTANEIVEIDFIGGSATQSQCVGLGKTEWNAAASTLDFTKALYWSSNGTVLAANNGTAPTQVAGRSHRMRIVFDGTATNATLYFFEDANSDGSYTAMTPASATVNLSAELKAGTNIGFDPAEIGNLTVSRIYLS